MTKKLSAGNEDHYALRVFSSKLLGHIVRAYGKVYQTLAPRATKTLLRCLLDAHKNPAAIFGALAGLVEIVGQDGVHLLIIPNVAALEAVISNARLNAELKGEAERLALLLHDVLRDHLKGQYELTNWGERTKADIVNSLKDKYLASYGSYGPGLFTAYQ